MWEQGFGGHAEEFAERLDGGEARGDRHCLCRTGEGFWMLNDLETRARVITTGVTFCVRS